MLKIIEKYRCIINYLFFGICTTIVNILMYAVCTRLFAIDLTISTCIAWISAVLFAYVTNRKWVFKSNVKGLNRILEECFYFFVCRI